MVGSVGTSTTLTPRNRDEVRHSGSKTPFTGAGSRNRTRDLLITSQLLYRLSYTGENCEKGLARYFQAAETTILLTALPFRVWLIPAIRISLLRKPYRLSSLNSGLGVRVFFNPQALLCGNLKNLP